ncbi:MAG: BatA domain-containing protein [Verrucomicrobiae bacterium]|nr:BatA domain-containing protein [Verrucomicrobiae bacterium]
MSFLAPWFLLGGAALALPVIFHLIRRTTRQRTRFSSLMFLQPTPPRLTRRSRLEDLLLLALRCLALGLLAFGFARPFLKDATAAPASAATGSPRVVLLDTSASMQRDGAWDAARERLEALVRAADPMDTVAVFTFDRTVVRRVGFDAWSAAVPGERPDLVARALETVRPGWGSTQLGAALIQAADALVERDAGVVSEQGRIIVISDLQEGSRLDTLQAYEWPKGIEVVLSAVLPKRAGNASLNPVGEASGGPGPDDGAVRVRVGNSSDAREERFQVGWAGPDGREFVTPAIEVYVPPGQSRVVAVPSPEPALRADRLVLQGDAEPFDNTVFTAPPGAIRSRILYLGPEAASEVREPLYFLQRALPATPRMTVEVVARPPTAVPAPGDWEDFRLIVVTDTVDVAVADALRAAVADGRTVLAAPRSAAALASLAPVLNQSSLSVSEASPAGYAMLAEIEFRHPLFAPFADPRFNDFTRLHFWKHRRLDVAGIPGARVVARFDRGDPALVEVPAASGTGRLLLLTSGWNPGDSQFALSSKFVPWIFSLLELAGVVAPPSGSFTVGDAIPRSAWGSGISGGTQVIGPDGTAHPFPETAQGFTETALPGLYTLGSGGPARVVAVNLDPAEGRTPPLAADELERLGVPAGANGSAAGVRTTPAAAPQRPDSVTAEGRQKLWRWFLAATLALLLAETAVAGFLSRRAAPAPV